MNDSSLWDLLLEAGLTEEQIQSIMEMSGLQGEGRLAQTQYEQANLLRRSPWPSGRWTGRVYTRAHPLEHVAAGVDRVLGGLESQRQLGKQRQMIQEQARLRGEFGGSVLGRKRAPPDRIPTGSMSPVQVSNPVVDALRRMDPYQTRMMRPSMP